MKIIDQIEEEVERALKEDGNMIEVIYLGKEEINKFIDELLIIDGTPEYEMEKEKQDLLGCDIIIDCYEDSKIKVVATNKDSEIRFVYKTNRYLN